MTTHPMLRRATRLFCLSALLSLGGGVTVAGCTATTTEKPVVDGNDSRRDTGTSRRDTRGGNGGDEPDTGVFQPDADDDTGFPEEEVGNPDDDTSVEPTDTDPVEPDTSIEPTDTTVEPDTAVTPDVPVEPVCDPLQVEAETVLLPVDIIFAIDTSGSMDREIEIVEQRLQELSNFLSGSAIDARLIMIAGEDSAPHYQICVPPPISGGGCPEADGPSYRRIQEVVSSTNAWNKIVDTYPRYQDFLRPNSIKHIVVVTDDVASMTKTDFRNRINGLTNPGFGSNWKFHAIASRVYPDQCTVIIFIPVCETVGCSGPYGNAMEGDQDYIDLANETGGVFAEICSADWGPIFTQIGQSIEDSARLPCQFLIPPQDPNILIDYTDVDVLLTANGQAREVPYVGDPIACSAAGGWYYDNAELPSQILLCPASCGGPTDELDVTFGCTRIKQ